MHAVQLPENALKVESNVTKTVQVRQMMQIAVPLCRGSSPSRQPHRRRHSRSPDLREARGLFNAKVCWDRRSQKLDTCFQTHVNMEQWKRSKVFRSFVVFYHKGLRLVEDHVATSQGFQDNKHYMPTAPAWPVQVSASVSFPTYGRFSCKCPEPVHDRFALTWQAEHLRRKQLAIRVDLARISCTPF